MLNRILDSMWGQATNLLTAPIRRRRWMDILVLLALAGLFAGLVIAAREWTVLQRPKVEIDLSPLALPRYAFLSIVRAGAAYALSAAFTLGVAYWAAKDTLAERVLIPILDILQSVPLLAFMPVVLLAMVGLFPRSNVGIELSAVLLIVTCQAWNMAFSLYQSLKTVPRDLEEVARGYGLNWLQRFRWVELPFATPGLVWNSMVSVANGWFFLMASEAFNLGSRDFRLPGIGAYMSVAVNQGDVKAQLYAIGTMLLIVVLLDQLLWKPVVAWSQRFQMDEAVKVEKPQSWLLRVLRRSALANRLRLAWRERMRAWAPRPRTTLDTAQKSNTAFQRGLGLGMLVMLLIMLALGAFKLWGLLSLVTAREWGTIFQAGAASMGRVLTSTALATCWTVPVGLWIGLSPTWSRRLQPVVQVVASFPASILFVTFVVLLQRTGIGLFTSSILLMSLSTQWYLLFNIIAGAQAIPSNLREAARAYRFGLWGTAWKLYFPSVFPFLVTGWVTATGGAWNASIITEYVQLRGQTFTTFGLGATVAQMADQGNIPLLTASALLMAGLVVLFNRLVWVPLYRLAETKYSVTR
ncbi:MAG: ABC transporter permease subunit [Acidobacteria bacterium]|nr:ABC transporter permease subunit [Acidobacteriota bacterium]